MPLFFVFRERELAPENNITSSENDDILIPKHSVEINPSTPSQPMNNNSSIYSDQNVSYVTGKIPEFILYFVSITIILYLYLRHYLHYIRSVQRSLLRHRHRRCRDRSAFLVIWPSAITLLITL
jgi:hypothetical protein